MTDFTSAIEALDVAERELQAQLDKLKAAKAALQGSAWVEPAPKAKRKYTKHKKNGFRHRQRRKCEVCKRGYLADRKNSRYCSRKCGRNAYELRIQRHPSYMPGGALYHKLLPGIDPATETPSTPKAAKPVVLLKGDRLAP